MALHRLAQVSATPPPPPAGYVILYFKTDNVLYIQGSDGIEHAIGTVNDITDLHGDVVAHGPGDVPATVTGIQNHPVSATVPTDAQFLVWNGTNYVPVSVSGDATMSDTGAMVIGFVGGSSASSIHAAEQTANSGLVSYPGSGLSVNYNAFIADFNGTVSYVTAGSLLLGGNLTNNWIYVDTTATVASGATLPPNAVPLALFSTNLSAVTFLEDSRIVLNKNQVWGLLSDIHTVGNAISPSAGTSEKFARADHVHAVTITSAAPITDLSATTTNNAGSASTYSLSDHTHAIDTGTPVTQTPDQSNSTGSSSNIARADHVHNIPTAAPASQTPDQSNADGSAATFSRADHIHNIATAAPITDLTPLTTNARGSASTFARSDHTHAIDSGTPVTQTPDQSNSAGSAASFAKSDHIHNIPSGLPVNIGTSNMQGSASSFALSDHIHAITSPIIMGLLLTGYSPGTNTPIGATNSILTAFENLQAQISATAGSAITSLTGDVVATGPGAVAATIQPNVVSNSKLAQMAANTLKGNNTGVTANAADLTVSQVNTMLGDVTTIGSLDGQSPVANALVIVGNTLFAQSADSTHPGMVNNTTQTMSGAKTFSTSVTSPAFISGSANPAAAGAIRLANGDNISWRNVGNTADISIQLDGGNILHITESSPQINLGSGTTTLIGLGMNAPQAQLHFGSSNGNTNTTTGTVGANSIVLGKLHPTNNLGAGATIIGGTQAGALTASGQGAIAIGEAGSRATGNFSVAIGDGAIAQALASVALGNAAQVDATNTRGVAIGRNSFVSGDSATTLGYGASAQGFGQTVVGTFNVVAGTGNSRVSTDDIFIVGIGTADVSRANAFSVSNDTTTKLWGATSGYIGFKPAASTTTHTWNLPATQGSSGTYLSNDGSGNLTWTNPLVNIDGGSPDSVYTSGQFINGGTP